MIVFSLINLALSVALTALVFANKNSIIDYQLDHRHVVDPQLRADLRSTYAGAIWGRVAGNVVASVMYAFLVRTVMLGGAARRARRAPSVALGCRRRRARPTRGGASNWSAAGGRTAQPPRLPPAHRRDRVEADATAVVRG